MRPATCKGGTDPMSHRTPRREKTFEEEPQTQYSWIVYAVAMLLVGGLAGYVLSATTSRSAPPSAVTASAPAPPTATDAAIVDEVALKTYRDILARDPKNVQAAVSAGNMLYDAKRYEEASPLYQQAMSAGASDVNVSTDLGTALWYTGRADAALAQYTVSLSIDPGHAQTLFNVGIVKSDGKKDYAGAAQAWETLLQKNPGYPNASKVRSMIADAHSKIPG
jgi:cytochrome c-type biogenesis protein CcmH/NrfG